MIRNKKAMLFCSQIILTGALITGAPCLAAGAEIEVAEEDGTSGSVFGSSATTADSEEVDHSGEGQIHKPSSLEVPDFTSDPDFVDDSTDNTYGYYTIMGDTTVSLAQMTSQYEEHGAEYPSASLKDGGAATIDDFCTIILEEANAEGVRGEVVFEQAMLETDGCSTVVIPEYLNIISLALERPAGALPEYLTRMCGPGSAHRYSISKLMHAKMH